MHLSQHLGQQPCATARSTRRSRVLVASCQASSAVLSPAATQPAQWRIDSNVATSSAQQAAADTEGSHTRWAPAPAVAPAPQQQPRTANVLVDFSIQYACVFGQELCLCGSAPELGAWDAAQAIPLAWASDTTWRATLTVAVSTRGPTTIEYKYIVRDAVTGAVIRWQDGDNMVLEAKASSRSSGHFEVVDSWDGSTRACRELQHHAQVMARSSQVAQPTQQELSTDRASSGRSASRGRSGSSESARNNISCLPPGWRTKAAEVEVIHLGGALQPRAATLPPTHPSAFAPVGEAPHFWAPGLHNAAQTPTDAAAASLSSHDGDAGGSGASGSSSADASMLRLACRTLAPAEMAGTVARVPPARGAVLCAATHLRMCHALATGGDAGMHPLSGISAAAAVPAAAAAAAPSLGAVPADAVAAAASMANAAATDAAAAVASVTDAVAADAASAAALVGVAAAVELRRELLDPTHARVLAADRAIARASRQLCSMMADDGGSIA